LGCHHQFHFRNVGTDLLSPFLADRRVFQQHL
jgi:hypothetical protein